MVHQGIDAEVVDARIQEAVARRDVENLQVCADRFRGERRRHARDAFRDLTHVDENEYPGDLGARPHQRIGEMFDCLATPDRIIGKQNSPTRDVCASDWWLAELVTAVSRLPDEGERQPPRQRDGRGKRDARSPSQEPTPARSSPGAIARRLASNRSAARGPLAEDTNS
jgi:hypothetical protein